MKEIPLSADIGVWLGMHQSERRFSAEYRPQNVGMKVLLGCWLPTAQRIPPDGTAGVSFPLILSGLPRPVPWWEN
jgi:hypothetical protein